MRSTVTLLISFALRISVNFLGIVHAVQLRAADQRDAAPHKLCCGRSRRHTRCSLPQSAGLPDGSRAPLTGASLNLARPLPELRFGMRRFRSPCDRGVRTLHAFVRRCPGQAHAVRRSGRHGGRLRLHLLLSPAGACRAYASSNASASRSSMAIAFAWDSAAGTRRARRNSFRTPAWPCRLPSAIAPSWQAFTHSPQPVALFLVDG